MPSTQTRKETDIFDSNLLPAECLAFVLWWRCYSTLCVVRKKSTTASKVQLATAAAQMSTLTCSQMYTLHYFIVSGTHMRMYLYTPICEFEKRFPAVSDTDACV